MKGIEFALLVLSDYFQRAVNSFQVLKSMNTKQPISLNQACDTIHIFLEENENIVNHYELSDALDLLWNGKKGQGKISREFNSFLRHKINNRVYFGKGGVNDILQRIGFRPKEIDSPNFDLERI